jgi:hypothetical protein
MISFSKVLVDLEEPEKEGSKTYSSKGKPYFLFLQ